MPKGNAVHETLVRHSIVPLQRLSAQLGRRCAPLKSLRSRHSADTALDVCPFVARRAARGARQSAGTGGTQIFRSMSPNSRRVRWLTDAAKDLLAQSSSGCHRAEYSRWITQCAH